MSNVGRYADKYDGACMANGFGFNLVCMTGFGMASILV